MGLPVETYRTGSYLKVIVSIALGIWVTLLSSCASSGISLFKLIPAEGQISTASVHDDQVLLSARYLDAQERVEYLEEKGYGGLGLGLRQVKLVTFAVTVKNGSDGKLLIDPGSIRLAVGYGPLLSPYNYSHLYMELPTGSDRQGILQDLSEAVFDRSATLSPGEVKEGLLLFKRPEKVGPDAALIFKRLYIGAEETGAVLAFKTVDLG